MATSKEVYDTIRSDLIQGKYKTKHILDPRKIAEFHMISVAPVREALLRLSERGLIRWERNRGFFVEIVSLSEALFLISQLETAFTVAYNRLADHGGDIKSALLLYWNGSINSIEHYNNLLHHLQSHIFSDCELAHVTIMWDKLWYYRNKYMSDHETRSHLLNGGQKALLALNDGNTKVCISETLQLFEYVRQTMRNTNYNH